MKENITATEVLARYSNPDLAPLPGYRLVLSLVDRELRMLRGMGYLPPTPLPASAYART